MAYVGIQTQIRRNNFYSLLQLVLFPVLLCVTAYAISAAFQVYQYGRTFDGTPAIMLGILAGCGIWFIAAYLFHQSIINNATGAVPLNRQENKRVYNLVENLCISQGMKMPAIYIIYDNSLNAFASGINDRTYAVTLSKGIVDKLDDAELEGVIAHELAHIINRDVRLLIVSIIFVGIFSFVSNVAFRSLQYTDNRRDDKKGVGVFILVVALITAVAYLLALMLRFGISRNREYMADAGSAEMTRNPHALASALRKISADPNIEAVENSDVAQLFIEHPQVADKRSWHERIFASHPPIQKRIELLEQFV